MKYALPVPMTRHDTSSFNHAIYVPKRKFAAPLGVRYLSLAGYLVKCRLMIPWPRALRLWQTAQEV
jgi:hypothetical protein